VGVLLAVGSSPCIIAPNYNVAPGNFIRRCRETGDIAAVASRLVLLNLKGLAST
jgi:hypothetical protein